MVVSHSYCQKYAYFHHVFVELIWVCQSITQVLEVYNVILGNLTMFSIKQREVLKESVAKETKPQLKGSGIRVPQTKIKKTRTKAIKRDKKTSNRTKQNKSEATNVRLQHDPLCHHWLAASQRLQSPPRQPPNRKLFQQVLNIPSVFFFQRASKAQTQPRLLQKVMNKLYTLLRRQPTPSPLHRPLVKSDPLPGPQTKTSITTARGPLGEGQTCRGLRCCVF